MPDCLTEYEPTFLCDLLDGLEANTDSLYRAWTLEHRKDEPGGEAGARLGYLGWDQNALIAYDTRNSVEAMRVMFARFLGDRKSEYNELPPPGAQPREPKTREATVQNAIAFFTGM